MERGPAGNTSLAAAFALARTLPEERILVVQETEYTGAGKHPLAQLDLARRMGVEVVRGQPRESQPGKRIAIPEHPSQIEVTDVDLERVRRSYLRHALEAVPEGTRLEDVDIDFLAAETRTTPSWVREVLDAAEAVTTLGGRSSNAESFNAIQDGFQSNKNCITVKL